MAQPGRPPKGPRRTLTTRVPDQHAAVYDLEARRRGLDRSDYLAWFLANAHGLEAPPWLERNKDQPELPTEDNNGRAERDSVSA